MSREPVSEAVRARQELTRLGLIEDSGERRRDPADGNLAVVWKLSPLGELVGDYKRLGMTWEEAWTRAKTAIGRPS